MSGKPGKRSTHHKQRQNLRRRLRAEGVPEAEVERQVALLRERQREARSAGVNPNDLGPALGVRHD